MLKSILTDTSLMLPNNFADGYDMLSGDVDQNHPSKTMPVALIVFGDTSHTDFHGTLALTPAIIFILSLFNQ